MMDDNVWRHIYAGIALKELIAKFSITYSYNKQDDGKIFSIHEALAKSAVSYADALLKELKR